MKLKLLYFPSTHSTTQVIFFLVIIDKRKKKKGKLLSTQNLLFNQDLTQVSGGNQNETISLGRDAYYE